MLSGYFKNRINHINPSQKTPLRQYFTETIMLQGFQAAKNRVFSTFLPYFLYILEAQTLSYLTKNAETLIFTTFQNLTIFSYKNL